VRIGFGLPSDVLEPALGVLADVLRARGAAARDARRQMAVR
jgi:hypothetical protein